MVDTGVCDGVIVCVTSLEALLVNEPFVTAVPTSKLKSKLDKFDRCVKSDENRLKVINDEINKLFVERLELNNSILDSKRKKKGFKDKVLKNI